MLERIDKDTILEMAIDTINDKVYNYFEFTGVENHDVLVGTVGEVFGVTDFVGKLLTYLDRPKGEEVK